MAPAVAPRVIAAFDLKLIDKLVALASEGRLSGMSLGLPSLGQKVTVQEVSKDGSLTLKLPARASSQTKRIEFDALSLMDRASLAGVVRRVEKTNKGACAFIGFYLMAAGHSADAQRFLDAAGEGGDEVRALFSGD